MNQPDITAARHRGNAESVQAHLFIHALKTGLREQVYRWFLLYPCGATCEEAAHALGMRYTTCSARISELKRDGKLSRVVRDGQPVRRKTVGGSSAAVLRAVGGWEREA